MVWFWKKKKQVDANANDANATVDGNATVNATTTAAATAAAVAVEAAVEAAVAGAQQSDKEWRRQAAQLRDQEKRVEKARARAAKRELALMKKQARAVRKERRKAEKRAQKQAQAVLKVHKREQKAERKRAKTIAKMRRSRQKRDKKLLRKRQKEERKRRRRARAEDQAQLRARDESAVMECETVAPPTATVDGIPLVAPTFKEDTSCNSCSSQFQRLPTRRRHHCRNCGESFCSKCLSKVKRPIPWFKLDKPQKVCFSCDVQVFNGMGGASARVTRSGGSNSVVAPATPSVEATQVQHQQRGEVSVDRRSPLLRAQSSTSFRSEQPEDSPRTASPPGSRNGLSFRLRPRSRRDASSSKSKKGGSIWTLPIRPLLKRKASADQLRNRNWDLDLRIEKEEMLARQRQSQMVAVTRAPQFATAS